MIPDISRLRLYSDCAAESQTSTLFLSCRVQQIYWSQNIFGTFFFSWLWNMKHIGLFKDYFF